MKHRASRSAFTLVELSIVLVILGLLVGGVLSGQALIRASELRTIVSERDRYVTAIYTFRDKYFSLPGDMPNAFAFWGTACGTNNTAASIGCNGDGNGIIEGASGENIKAWEHLSHAGLIEGNYDGAGVENSGYVTLAVNNTPASKFSQGYWNIGTAPTEQVIEYCDVNGYCAVPNLTLAFGSLDPIYVNDSWVGPLKNMTLGEAWNVDKKVDDGRSHEGKVRGRFDGECADIGTDYYGLAANGEKAIQRCLLQFEIIR